MISLTFDAKKKGSNISWCHFEAQSKPISEIRALEVLTVNLMKASHSTPELLLVTGFCYG